MKWLLDRPSLDGPPTRYDRLIIVGMANKDAEKSFSCRECTHFNDEDRGYELGDYDDAYCSRKEPISNLKTFPFKRAPESCFELDFWSSAYPTLMWDMSMETAFRLFKRTDGRGRMNLNARNEDQVSKALRAFMEKKPMEAKP